MRTTEAQVLREYGAWASQVERSKPREQPKFLDENFVEQSNFITDPAKLKVALTTRRAGKSYGDGLYLLKEAWSDPIGDVLYIAITRDSVKRSLWERVLKPINRRLKLGGIANETTLSMRLPNGAIVYSLGGDASQEDQRKLLSGKYKLIIVDEGGAFRIDLNRFIFGTLKPMVADFNGTICLTGFPSNVKAGLFYELTQGQDPQTPGIFSVVAGEPAMKWSGHRWNTSCNPHMRDNWHREISEMKANNPRIEETPLFQQHYLGRWVIDENKLVYRYLQGRNEAELELPQMSSGAWHYVLGVDLGYEDPTAFTVCAYHQNLPELYVLESIKTRGLDITSVAARIKNYQRRYDFERILIDNSNKQAVAEMQARHGLSLTPAEKTGKSDFIEIMNGEFIQGRIKLSPQCQPLKDEYANLIWDEQALKERGKREEHSACANHCADATLYAWRYCYPYLSEALVAKPKLGTVQFQEETAKQMLEEEREKWKQRQRKDNEPTWDDVEPQWDERWPGG